MTYITIDGTVLTSGPTPVTHRCPCTSYTNGTYESFETTGSSDAPGIKQIKIVRVVENNTMTTTITESSLKELEAYINSITEQ
jgi:hypothetical protein